MSQIKAWSAAASLSITAVVLPQAASALTNFALSSKGASFIAASSYNGAASTPAKRQTMEDNLLTATQTAWLPSGEKRFIFDAQSPRGSDQWLEISLGHIRKIDEIAAHIDPPPSDRYVVGPFSVEVSTNGTTWTDWGSPEAISTPFHNPAKIDAPAQDVEFIRYDFGPSDPDWGYGGSALARVFAYGTLAGVPEPANWVLMLIGFAGLGRALRSRGRGALA